MIEIKKFTSDYSQTFNSTFLPLDTKNIKNGRRYDACQESKDTSHVGR
jgi:hypothetical protein